MISVRSIESLAAGDGRPNLFRTLGPTLLISMGYIDLGKWLATMDAGSRFGYDQVLLVLLFNFSAILFQYQSICIGMVTGKNLKEEYSETINVVLSLQAGLSLIIAELTMVSGITVGFNLVFEYGGIITGLCFSSVVVYLLPHVISRLGRRMAGTFNACIAGFTLLCFVLGLLVSQPKVPVNVNVMFPKLSGESAYSLMALLGANVITYGFYVHSSVVQVQRRSLAPTLGSLFHDHLFSVLFVFTGVFLVNYVLLSSAADESSNITLVNYQDGIELMNQMFESPVAPVLLLVILIFSSHIISLTSIIGSDVILKNTFGVKLPDSAHHLLLKGFAIIPCIYCGKVAGFEGIYQLLIICPVIQAMFLPSTVIPLIRISSSRLIMGCYKISLYVEILATLAFLLMLFANIIFVAEILFGDSTWTNNLKGNTGSGPVLLPYIVIVLTSFASIAFTLFLAVTPLKSASNEAENENLSVCSHSEALNIAHYREETSLESVPLEEVQWSSIAVAPRDSLEGHQKSALEYTECSDTATESDHDAQEPTSHRTVDPEAHLSPPAFRDEPKFVEVDWTEPMSIVCTDTIVEQSTAENIKVKSATEKIVPVEPDVCAQKDSEVSHDLEFDKSYGGKVPSFPSGGPPSLMLSRGDDTDAGNVSGFISKQSGLGRAARRQLAAILDEFWGQLFDYRGKLTQEANNKSFNYLIGLDLRAAGSAVRKDNLSIEASSNSMMRDVMQGSATVLNTWDSHDKDITNQDTGICLQVGTMGPPTWSQSMHLPNRDIPSSGRTFFEQNAKLFSNFHTPSYSSNQFYQPATIHGYQLANYLKGINASRNPYSSTPLDPWQPPRSSESAIPTYTGSAMNAHTHNLLGSFGDSSLQSPTLNRSSTMAVERSYYDPISIGGSDSVGSSANSKKYHSSPNISAVIAASRDALLNEASLGPAANLAYLTSLASEKSRYVDLAVRPSSPLTELSQHNVQREMLSTHSGTNTKTKFLWSQQPFEQLFGVLSSEVNRSEVNTGQGACSAMKDDFSYTQFEAELLKSLRFCIMKLLKLEGSEWLFRQNGGCDENLIDKVSETERVSQGGTSDDRDTSSVHRVPNCGDGCVWQASLIVSFGVWCIHRVLDLSRVESRPELWGKYTYVLNRLQGIIDPSLSNPRKPLMACACLLKAGSVGKPIPGSFITAAMILEVIKGVEQAVSGRKGRSGTAAGDVAFPKGKANLLSVLKRYKRRLGNKTPPRR
ncbi:protein ETHYLENE-INSENSITIVE 2 isoform X2 [Sorghum bicolor]|uniref:protein ETHYLENE-INSENSITIVE 2 isoform X2 n=1 Tax=Sorghum bicolor TaxID=4558 RepID=UPI000B425FA5|nr:protein ETHYLENE-INSENSITIVE 2 isoform X2 [Sorghum bicolor]|eukprot:XP_021301638.1 protein ETHYLENE-INSENSITIVE 2 isoform X2 [Sorghum bicolor]